MMPSQEVYAAELGVGFEFDPVRDHLGSGTIGEVFRVTAVLTEKELVAIKVGGQFALKRFFPQGERNDFDNESMILKEIEAEPHEHILASLAIWTDHLASYILLPLADTDLSQLLQRISPSSSDPGHAAWLLRQARGLCSAIECLHNYDAFELWSPGDQDQHCIGFHHDIKPANILVYGTEIGYMIWKLGDFGSGTVQKVASPSQEIYNRKASTGDSRYSAPEFVIDGKVSRPKDIWSLGCVFLEVLIWYCSDDTQAGVEKFEKARTEACTCVDGMAHGAMKAKYWCLQMHDEVMMPLLNPAVLATIDRMRVDTQKLKSLEGYADVVQMMLNTCPRSRPRAKELCQTLDVIMSGGYCHKAPESPE